MEESSGRDVTSCELDLHQVSSKVITARNRDASHARRYVKLHPFS